MSDIIVRTIHGSHLYGLNTPASDRDYKSVYMPDIKTLYLSGPDQHRNSSTKEGTRKNTNEDVDTIDFSLVNFVHQLRKGEMIAFDMIHSPKEFVIESNHLWPVLQANRELFYTKNMRSYMGYVRKQTAKYGFKGSRLDALQMAIAHLKQFDQEARMAEAIPTAPVDADYLFVKTIPGSNATPTPHYEVLGSLFSDTTKIKYVLSSLVAREKEYGHRARAAQTNEGVDWKAVSHAFRAGFQLRDLFTNGTMTLPLGQEERDYILPIKRGEKNWLDLQGPLEDLMIQVNELAEKSTFPDKVDDAQVDHLIVCISESWYGV